VLWLAAAGVALAALALVFLLPLLRPQVGTVVIAGSGRAAGTVSSTQIRLHGTAGWAALGSVSGDYPAAPGPRELLVVSVAVVAAFNTSCHQTCPLYTALFFQLQRSLPGGVQLAEVTTDPLTDSPSLLHEYAQSIGATWTFATASRDALAAFWKPFDVDLSSGD